MKLNISLFLEIFLLLKVACSSGNTSGNKTKRCEYRNSVDLTNFKAFENGSYLYHDILIPPEKVFQFDFKMQYQNKRKMVESHSRGCVCGNDENRRCANLCCEKGSFFNESSHRCEQLPEHFEMPTNVTIRFDNDSDEEENFFEHFVYQVGVPCAKPVALSTEVDVWILLEDGMLDILSDKVKLGTNSYCYSPHQLPDSGHMELWPMSCPMKNEASFALLFNSYGMAISVIFFIATVIIYLALKELRGCLKFKLLICYLISMATGYSTLAFINTTQIIFSSAVCMSMGFIGYFAFIAGFLWLGILGFDIWISFSRSQIKLTWEAKLFQLYSLFVWSVAGIMLAVAVWSQLSPLVSDVYKPGISSEMCWLNTKKWSAAIYFYVPSSVILLFNIVIFTRVSIRVCRERRNATRLTNQQKCFHQHACFIIRLFIIMGISWVMDIISYSVRNFKGTDLIFEVTDFYNAIQGVIVFILLVCKRNIFILLKRKCSCQKNENDPASGVVSMTSLY